MRGRRRTDGWLGARGCPTRIPYGAAPDFRCGVHRPGDESAHRPGRVVSVEKRICHRLAEGVEGILPDLPVPKTFQGRLAQANIERHREQAPKSFPGAVEPLPTVVQEAEVCRTRTRSRGRSPGVCALPDPHSARARVKRPGLSREDLGRGHPRSLARGARPAWPSGDVLEEGAAGWITTASMPPAHRLLSPRHRGAPPLVTPAPPVSCGGIRPTARLRRRPVAGG